MRILFMSDIHGNLPALLSLEKYFNGVDKVICLGDIVGYHCYVNEVINFLVEHNVTCIQGNHDRYVFEGLEIQTKVINDSVRFGIEIAQKKLTERSKEWIHSLPTSFSIKVDDLSILCCHGSPWDVTNGYIYADSVLFPKMSDFAFDVIALGHTHRAYTKQIDKLIIFNPGSVGQARDTEGKACAKIFDTTTKEFEVIQEPYDFMTTLNDSVSNGAQDWIYKHFKTVI
jgi:putative phosphoesterase